MPFEMFWYVENRVVGTRLYGELTKEEFFASGQAIDAWAHRGTPPLFLVVDFRDVAKLPPNLGELMQGLAAEDQLRGTEFYWTIILSTNALYNFFGVLVSKNINSRLHICKNYAEANEFLARMESDLALPSPEIDYTRCPRENS